MAHANPVLKLYKSVIEDVIEGVRELFAEEGLEEHILKDLKQLWETKVMQSKATEGFFRHVHRAPQFTLQLSHNLHRVLQTSAAASEIPTGRGFQHVTATDLGASRVGATLTLPLSIAYPIHVPAGVTLQTASDVLELLTVEDLFLRKIPSVTKISLLLVYLDTFRDIQVKLTTEFTVTWTRKAHMIFYIIRPA